MGILVHVKSSHSYPHCYVYPSQSHLWHILCSHSHGNPMEMGIPFPCTSLVVLRGYRPAESGGFLGHTETVLWTVEGERICSGRLFQLTGAAT